MFVFDPTFAAEQANIDSALEHLMSRAGGEVVVAAKWDERKLAYEIAKRKRGCYVLVFFKAPPESLVGIERDCRLHENILRVLITTTEDMSDERRAKITAQSPAGARKEREPAARPAPAPTAEASTDKDKDKDKDAEQASVATATATATAEAEAPKAKPETDGEKTDD